MKQDGILILDFGGNGCYFAGRKVRELEVYSEVAPHNITLKEIRALSKKFNVKGIIFSDSIYSVNQANAPVCNPEILKTDIPVLGISYGYCLLARIFGGKVQPASKKERGEIFADIKKPLSVLEGLDSREKVWAGNCDIVSELSKEFEVLASAENCPTAAFKHKDRQIYGILWNPEFKHTENGAKVLKNFLFNICRCRRSWTTGEIIENAIHEIKSATGNKKAIIALSGGIDSSTAAVISAKAIGRNLTAIFVDSGLMLENELESVRLTLEKLNINLIQVDAKQRFLEKLRGVEDTEQKRWLIGEEFIRVFEEAAKKIGAEYLIQGTIYPNRIESGITRRHYRKIKTYHNTCGLSEGVEFKGIIEPLRDLYKDEVRKVAESLGLPKKIVWRQPFPGTGLAIRIIGEVTPEKIQIVRRSESIVAAELEKSGVSEDLWQYFAVLTDMRTTGVNSNSRSYGYVAAIRAVVSNEALTASFARIPYDILENISSRITSEIPEITRVVYDITHKPPAAIEWE